MALIVLTSATGAPGTTTTALGLTLTWPRNVLLADCNREPAQAVQAGYLRGMDLGGRGMSALARLHRESQTFVSNLTLQSVLLTEDDEVQRRYLPGFGNPGAVRLFDHIWPDLANGLADLSDRGIDVIVDAGHIGPEGLPLPLLAAADAVSVITRTNLPALASTRLYLPILNEQLASLPVERPLGLLLVGAGRPYGAAEITAQFGAPCWAEVPWHSKHASVLSQGDDEPRRFADTTLMNQYRVIASNLMDRLERESQLRHQLAARYSYV